MNSRERVIRAITRTGPDRVPVMYACFPATLRKYGAKARELFERYPQDFGFEGFSHSDDMAGDARYLRGTWKDEWGCLWQNLEDGLIGQVIGHPLDDWSKLRKYRPPDPKKIVGADIAKMNRMFERCGHAKFVFSMSDNSFFERMHYLRGYENLLIDIAEENENLPALADMIFEYNLALIEMYAGTQADSIYFSDDWGTQNQLMIRPEKWRSFFRPYYEKMFERVKASGKFVYIHSDGYIMDIIGDLIEIGADVINPQEKVCGVDNLAAVARGKVCIATDMEQQGVLPRGTADEIRQYVQTVFRKLSDENGGLIARCALNPDAGLQNAEAMLSAFFEYGSYPMTSKDVASL